MQSNSLQERRASVDRRTRARRATDATARIPTRRGDVLILFTAQSFAVHAFGPVSEDSQQDFHSHANVKYEPDQVAAVAGARAVVNAGGHIFFRNLDSGEWSEIPR
jgi:hypothetical protein